MESSCLTALPRTEMAPAATTCPAATDSSSLLGDIAAAGRGQPLPAGHRARLEQVLNADLAQVRVHTGPAADRLARALGADAFTCGSGIFFRDGAYQPGTRAGAWLLAHEVVHVVQQARAAADGTAPTTGLTVSAPGDPGEQAADALADRALAAGASHGTTGPAVVITPGPSRWIQRHVSFEHRYLGDGPTADLVAISSRTGDWRKLVQQQVDLAGLWRSDWRSVNEDKIKQHCPWIRTVRIGPDQVLVTYGELNALPDYLADAATVDTLGQDMLVPILQVIRQEAFNQLTKIATDKDPNVTFADAVCAPWRLSMVNTIIETGALDTFTLGLGIRGENHYQGLLARNACHFAPFSWHRWQASHVIARDLAHRAWKGRGDSALTRRAWTYHGYADHFLQDSFAAGHLINKTLIMQWFLEWAAARQWFPADWDALQDMTQAKQPDLSGRWLYDPANPGPSNDPQTAQEAALLVERVLAGSVRSGQDGLPSAYQKYLTFLTSAAAGLGSATMHDYYCDSSLWVASAFRPEPFRVWGDHTLLTGDGGADGVQATSTAAQLSQQALADILASGKTDISVAAIRRHFPTAAGARPEDVQPLADWATSTAHKAFCFDRFDAFLTRLKDIVVGLASPRLGIASQDQEFASLWSTSLPGSGYAPAETLVTGNRLFSGSNGYLYELHPESGKVLGSTKLGGGPVHLTTDGTVLYASVSGTVAQFKLGTPITPAWTTEVGGDEVEVVISKDGRVFAGSAGTISQIDPGNGRILQQVQFASPVGSPTTRLKLSGDSLFAGIRGYAYKLDIRDGSRWQCSLPSAGLFEVNLAVTGTGRLFAGSNGYAYELDPGNGTVQRSLKLSAAPGPVTRLATDGTTLFVGVFGYAYGISLDQAWITPAWTTSMKGLTSQQVTIVSARGRLFAASNGYVYQLDPGTGRILHSLLLSYSIGVGDFDVSLTTAGRHLYAGVHGYQNRLLVDTLPDAPGGMAGWWPLNNSGLGLAGGLNDLTPSSSVTWSIGPEGGYANFNGTDALLTTAGPVLHTDASFTVTARAWLRESAFTSLTVLSQSGRRVSAFELKYDTNEGFGDGHWAFARRAADTDGASVAMARASTPAPARQWAHLAGVYDATAGQLRLYVDGALAGTAPYAPGWDCAERFVVGCGKNRGSLNGHFAGAISEVRAYTRALSDAEVLAISGLVNELETRIPFDEGTGDQAVNLRDPQPVRGTGSFGWGPGISGTCVVLDGGCFSTDRQVNTDASYTVAAWARLAAAKGNGTVLSQDGQQVSGFCLQYLAGSDQAAAGRWAFSRVPADTATAVPVSSVSVAPAVVGEWVHLAGVYDAASDLVTLYVNGVPAPSQRAPGRWAATGQFHIGQGRRASLPTEPFGGSVDEVRTWQRALSAEEVQLLI